MISGAAIGIFSFYNPFLAVSFLLSYIVVFFLLVKVELSLRKETEKFVIDFSKRLSEVSEEAVSALPIGMLLHSEDFEIEWSNGFAKERFGEIAEAGQMIDDLSTEIKLLLLKKSDECQVEIDGKVYQVDYSKKFRVIYLTDITDFKDLRRSYEEERNVIAMLFLDSYDDVTQGMDDQLRSSVQNVFTSEIMKWARENDVLLRRISSDRFIGILNEGILMKLEKNKFHILDDVRQATLEHGVPLTLSIGIGSGTQSIPELGSLAQSGLDLALGRGGDQAVVKMKNGKARFYGGKTNPTGRRTRVRARVISHALRDLIRDSENVIIMGHKNPDMDVYGPAIGLLKIAEVGERDGFIVMDRGEVDSSLEHLFTEIQKDEVLFAKFLTPEKALEKVTEGTLLIVVDTHKPTLVIEEKLLDAVSKVVVIDHHRRGEHVINNPILSYMEPYASSTAELVTEIIEYHPGLKKLDSFVATVLLAGIVVDTKNFTLRTGARTFDAASFLRLNGADLVRIQGIFKEDIDQYMERNRLIESVFFYHEGLAVAYGDDEHVCSPVQVAKAADTLLGMKGVQASFVIARRTDSQVGISARSLGDINVQVIMEELSGGGHLTNAATQVDDVNIDEAKVMLQKAIDRYLEGRNDLS